MFFAVYKSPKKDQTYLYLAKRDDFSAIPEALLKTFGTPQFVFLLPLSKISRLANACPDKVVEQVNTQGFYLQIPPPVENLLKAFKAKTTSNPSC